MRMLTALTSFEAMKKWSRSVRFVQVVPRHYAIRWNLPKWDALLFPEFLISAPTPADYTGIAFQKRQSVAEAAFGGPAPAVVNRPGRWPKYWASVPLQFETSGFTTLKNLTGPTPT